MQQFRSFCRWSQARRWRRTRRLLKRWSRQYEWPALRLHAARELTPDPALRIGSYHKVLKYRYWIGYRVFFIAVALAAMTVSAILIFGLHRSVPARVVSSGQTKPRIQSRGAHFKIKQEFITSQNTSHQVAFPTHRWVIFTTLNPPTKQIQRFCA